MFNDKINFMLQIDASILRYIEIKGIGFYFYYEPAFSHYYNNLSKML